LLVAAGRAAGAEVRHGVALSELQFGAAGGRVIGASLRDASGACATVRSDIVIGGDGRQSTVAQLANAKAYVEGHHSSVVYGHFDGLKSDGLHWHFAKNAASGVIPTNAAHCAFAGVPAQRFSAIFWGDVMRGFLQILEMNCPRLRADMEQAKLIGRLRGYGGATAHLRQCHGAGWALVGDAGYFRTIPRKG
jgi:flavin-dependent dehydrogenase